MEFASCICLLVILLICSHLEACNAYEKCEATTINEDHTRPEVTILQGSIRGINLSTKNNRNIAGFLGIPFAEPPLGDLRFRAPVPASAWNETLDAGSDTPDCPQLPLSGTEVLGDEDCLYINVYTPKLLVDESWQLLPVMMYIHGGGFIIGGNNSTLYGPGYLLDKDIVLVVPSYRLGAPGFLSTGDAESPGNWGLKDLVLALHWIRDNIAFFGGDPERVTILGNSAGSIAVNYLTLSDSTAGEVQKPDSIAAFLPARLPGIDMHFTVLHHFEKGYFLPAGLIHRYIMQSGSGLSTLGYQPIAAATGIAFRLGKYVGCGNTTSAILVECLRSANITDILSANSQFIEWEVYPRVLWAPTTEPDLKGGVLTETATNLIESGKIDNVPGIIGTLPGDGVVLTGYFHAHPDKFEEFLAVFDDVLPYVLNYHNVVKNVSAYTDAFKSYYFNDDLTSERTILLANLTRLCSDLIGYFPNNQELEKIDPSNSTYLYSFEYRGTYSYSLIWASGLTEDIGVIHSDELIYLFPQAEALFAALNKTMSETDLKMVDTMVQLWTSFATNGIPETTAHDESWPPYSRNMEHLRIGNRNDTSIGVEVEGADCKERIQFLSNLDVIHV